MEHAKAGRLLSGKELRETLDADLIFAQPTWHPDCVRTSAYDIRLAADLCIVPDGNGAARRYDRGEFRTRAISLEPGDSAIVSSKEQIHLDWSISAIIGTKFSLSAQGVLVLTGTCVDPGYGIHPEDGKWVPDEDQRLHFVLCNVGPETVILEPHTERIASVCFFRTEEPSERTFTPSVGFQALQHDYFADSVDSSVGLAYFRALRDTQEAVREQAERIQFAILTQGQAIEASDQRIGRVEGGFNSVVAFGVYLLAISILGVALSVTVGLAADLRRHTNPWSIGLALGSGAVLVAAVVTTTIVALFRILKRDKQ